MLNQEGIVWVPFIIWSAIILLTGTVAVKEKLITIDLSGNVALIQKVDVTPTPDPNLELIIPSPNPTSTPTTKPTQPVYVDPDPIIDCSSSAPNCKGSSIRVHQSQCSKITCCQVGDKWSIYRSSDQCAQDQNAANQRAYPSCAVYYPSLGYSKTYSMSASDCSYWQERAKVNIQVPSLPEIKAAPLPSVELYKPSQEYTDTYNRNIQEINKDWKPTQFVVPTPKCYATWDEYFQAYPTYGTNITGTSGTPPCD